MFSRLQFGKMVETRGAAPLAYLNHAIYSLLDIVSRILCRSRFQFYHREHIKHVSLIQTETKSGMVPVSSRDD